MRVLVVEDQSSLANYVRQALEEQNYAVDLAGSGREALDWAQMVEYDIIILDIMLPEIDGINVCRQLRSRGNQAAILMLTARDTVDDRVLGLDAGADDYLVKPFQIKELLARIRALSRRHTAQSSILKVADLSLDTRTRVVMRGDMLIKLTSKEHAILECLMRDPGSVVTRTEIAESVWNYDSFSQSNVVDVYIRNLRRKIDDPFGLKLIHTVRGAGYRLSDEDIAE